MDEELKISQHLYKLHLNNQFPKDHVQYLQKLKESGFEPNVIYDIGSCLLHWTQEVKKLWPNATVILFDAFDKAEFLYKKYDYYIGVLTDTDNKPVEFYQNNYMPCGNSYYKEIGSANAEKVFNKSHIVKKTGFTLDTVVKAKKFPLPDFIKIDVQGAELDIIHGAKNTLKNCKQLIVELQSEQYNENAPLADETIKVLNEHGFECTAPLFCNNGPDGDYGFQNTNQ
jgi:hypothetical protein